MENINPPLKGSIETVHFLNYFYCLICKEIGNFPNFLKCNHIYCENCVSNYNMKQNDESLICPFCFEITKKEELLPELEMRLLLKDIKSSDDEQFFKKYTSKLNFNNCQKCEFRNVVLFLLKFFSIENNCLINNKNREKKCYKRSYLDLKNNKFIIDNYNINIMKTGPLFKAN